MNKKERIMRLIEKYEKKMDEVIEKLDELQEEYEKFYWRYGKEKEFPKMKDMEILENLLYHYIIVLDNLERLLKKCEKDEEVRR